ncbi:hypothetical protein LZ32DRAFT_79179 [Colletotrichum eremochloae]|nr:hypothetical protein LZ32DRAFT_79179 [Colletotrichum eremochloae]
MDLATEEKAAEGNHETPFPLRGGIVAASCTYLYVSRQGATVRHMHHDPDLQWTTSPVNTPPPHSPFSPGSTSLPKRAIRFADDHTPSSCIISTSRKLGPLSFATSTARKRRGNPHYSLCNIHQCNP